MSGQGALHRRRVVVTRAAEQARGMLDGLRAAGAEGIALPTIAIAPPEDYGPLDRALGQVAAYDGFIFTSANGVASFFERARRLSFEPNPGRAWICALGPATAAALAERGWRASILPEHYVAEGVIAALAGRELRGKRLLLPRAAVARDVLPRALKAAGARVDTVAAYRTIVPAGAQTEADRLFPQAGKRPDAVLLTSSSTAQNLAQLLGAEYRRRLAGVALAAIGPITAATVRRLGLEAAIEASEYTSAGLLAALARYFESRSGYERTM